MDHEAEKGTIEFFHDTEFRRIEMLKLEVSATDEETVKSHITFGLNSTRQKTLIMQERLKDVMGIVEQRNPMLLNEICKGASAGFSAKPKPPMFS